MKVLIADDDPVWLRLLEKSVGGWGYEVTTASDGQTAWETLQDKAAPRIAILDWQMPKLDGVEICQRVRQRLSQPFIYTIILTSRNTREDMVIGLESGADDYLVKPVDMAVLRSRLLAAVRVIKAVQPPRKITGYQLFGRLGAGAMAIVYKGRQVSLDRYVAIKILPKKYCNTDKFVKRFYAEGRAAAKLNHPNIVAALDVGRQGDIHYFVMEYVEGHTIYERLVKDGPYSESEALDIGIQVARALNHAHQAGLIHRDVKPKNVLISREGVAKLADMGLARAVSDREAAEAEAGKACGTPYYISPEQIRGEMNIDFRADIYGFGVTLYHMVTGKVPFEGAEVSTILRKHLREDFAPPGEVNAELSEGICEIIELCMTKDRTQRYTATLDLIEDLQAVIRGKRPNHAHKLIGDMVAPDPETPVDQDETAYERPLFSTPLFWIAVTGWVVAAILAVVVVVLVT